MDRKRVKRVCMMGHTVKVRYKKGLLDQGTLGQARFEENEIWIDAGISSAELERQTLWHELVHWIFYLISEKELCYNEKLVDLTGQLLFQIERSMR